MKKGLFITLLMAILMPFCLQAQTKSSEHVVDQISACGTYTWAVNGQTYTTTQVVTYTSGDTLYVLDLTINPVYTTVSEVENVQGGCTYTWGDTVLAHSGTYTRTLQSSLGCDSLASINLTTSTSASKTYTVTACDTYTWKDSTYAASTNFTRTFADNVNHCDSILTLNLTILTPTQKTSDTTVTACDMVWFSFGRTFSEEQIFASTEFSTNDKITNPNSNNWKAFHKRGITQDQCYDSVRYAHITINNSTYTRQQVSGCDEYTFEGSYNTYNYTYTIDTATGDTTNTVIDTVVHEYSKIYTANNAGDTVMIGYNQYNCRDYAVLKVTINKSPVVSIAGNISILPGNSTTLYAVCDQNVNYRWSTGATTDSITTPVLNENTDYSLEATNRSTNCKSTSYVTVTVNEGIETLNDGLSIYPNPATSVINIECEQEISNFSVFNMMGQRVMNSYNMPAKSSINLNALNSGNYTIRVQLANGQVIVRNVVIAK